MTDSEGEGLVQFSIPTLEAGRHTAELKVWDILNNSTTHTFAFEVVEGLKPNLIDLYATPNPARQEAKFHLEHNRPESTLEVTLLVYDLTGKPTSSVGTCATAPADGFAPESISIGPPSAATARKR